MHVLVNTQSGRIASAPMPHAEAKAKMLALNTQLNRTAFTVKPAPRS